MFCTKCGHNNPDTGVRFCERCGAPLQAASAQSQPQPQPARKREPDPYFKAIKDFFKARELKGTSLVTLIVAASAALLLCVGVDGTFSAWFPALAAILLAVLCLFKLPYNTKLHAIVVSLFAARFIFEIFGFIFSLIGLVTEGYLYPDYIGYLFSAWFNSGWDIGISLISYAIVALYWLMACKVFKQKKVPSLIILILTGVNALYATVNFFIGFTVGYKTVFFYLGWMALCAAFILLFLFDEDFKQSLKAPAVSRPAPPQNGYSGYPSQQTQPTNSAAAGAVCPRCGAHNEPGTRFCTQCGNPLF